MAERKETHYIHFGNGDVKAVTDKELANNRVSSTHYRDPDTHLEHVIAGVYPKEVEYAEPEVEDNE